VTPAGDANRLIDARTGSETTWAELPAVDVPAPAAVTVASSYDALPWVRTHATTGAELLLVAASRMEHNLRSELLEAGFNVIEPGVSDRSRSPHEPEQGRLWLLTSGSTGRPKRIGHTLQSLTTVSGDLEPRRWLCPYSPGTYAWWQVVTLGLGTFGQDLVVVDPADLADWVAAGIEHRVTAASGTPTFWRQTIMTHGDDLGRVPLKQVSLGGEPVDQAVLDQLKGLFPQARVSWIYASSEVGASIVVHDGRAGFPVDWLDRDVPGRPRLAVQDGELVISSPHHGAGLGGAVRTGDAVVVEEGRVLITGRIDTDEINVGGAKVSAGVVRSVLQAHPQVSWAHVRGRNAPLVGRLVVADVVLYPGTEQSPELLAELAQWCHGRLPEYGVPRRIRVLPAIPAKETLKSDV
jgi:acyl-coenzyme A synthetase/AMP-(fatty) acid ligase